MPSTHDYFGLKRSIGTDQWNRLKWSRCGLLVSLLIGLFSCPPLVRSQDIPIGQEQSIQINSVDFVLMVDPPDALQPRLGRIANLFVERCVGCHNPESTEGGYSMATPANLFSPGESKKNPIQSGVAESGSAPFSFPQGLGELWERVATEDTKLRMPKDSDPLSWDELEEIRGWIATGARIDGGSDAPIESFLPISPPSEPKLQNYARPHPVRAIALDTESKTLFTSGYQEVLAWRWEPEWKLIARIGTRGKFISDIAWNGSQRSLTIASGEPGKLGFVESVPLQLPDGDAAWKYDSDPGLRRVLWVSRDTPLDVALSPNGEYLGIGNADGSVVVIDTSTSRMRWKSAAHAAAVTGIDWSRDNQILLSSSRDRMGKAFQVSDGTMVSSFVDSERTVASIAALDRGVVAYDEAGTIRFYPNFTTPNSKASRGGFPQRTEHLISFEDDFFVLDGARVRRFRVRRQEVVESKGEDGKEKKKNVFHFDEMEGIELNHPDAPQHVCAPIAIHGSYLSGIEDAEQPQVMIAVGCAGGEVFLWNTRTGVLRAGRNIP